MATNPSTHRPYDVLRDAAWIQGLHAGDFAAFDDAYLTLVPSLLAFVRRFAGVDVAEDVVQDVMVDLWERRESLAVRGTLRGYLFGAVRRRIADVRRHDGVVARYAAESLYPSPIPSPEQAFAAAEIERAMIAALATLPDRARTILDLRWTSGLSYAEIADALGISEDAAKKHGRRTELLVRTLLARFAPPA